MKKKNEKKMKLTTIKVARLTATEKNAFGVTRPTTTVIRTFDC